MRIVYIGKLFIARVCKMITSLKNKLKKFMFSADQDDNILYEHRKRKRTSDRDDGDDMQVVSVKKPKIQSPESSVLAGLWNSNTVQIMSDWVKGKRPNCFSWHSEKSQQKCHNGNGFDYNKTLQEEGDAASSTHHRFRNVNRTQTYKHGTWPCQGSTAADALTSSLHSSATQSKTVRTESELALNDSGQVPISLDLLRTRNKYKFTAGESVRLDDKVRYQQLLQQFTLVPLEQHESNARCSKTIRHPIRVAQLPRFFFSSNNSILGTTITTNVHHYDKPQILERPKLEVRPRHTSTSKNLTKALMEDDSIVEITSISPIAPEHPVKHPQATAAAYIDLTVKSDADIYPKTDYFTKSPIVRAHTIKSPTHDYRESKFLSENWLKDLTSSYNSKVRERDRQLAEAEIQAKIYDKRRKQCEDELEKKMQTQMHIYKREPAAVEDLPIELEDEVEDEVEGKLPELTNEMERKINSCLQPGNPGEILVEKFHLQIRRSDIATLGGLNWINDEIFNFYMNLLMERGGKDGQPKVYAFNTFFYPKVMSGGQTSVKRWTRQVDILAVDYILIPVHLGVHWCLAVINFKKKEIQYYDSMGGDKMQSLNVLKKYLCDESMDKKKKEFDVTGWKLTIVKDIPQQMNGSDCGVFACKYAEYITREAPISFTQQHMPYFRRRMIYEIVTGKLLQ